MSDQPKPTGELPCGCTIETGDPMESSVFWNPFNKVVQFHKCGHVYEPKQYPKSTGEWTFDGESRVLDADGSVICVGVEIQGPHIADTHNAALAAERKNTRIAAHHELEDCPHEGLCDLCRARRQLAAAVEGRTK